LALGKGDILVEARDDGYHLFVRQVGSASVLLTEAFEVPNHKLATYALKATGPNPANDAEKRLLDGKFLPQPHHSLMSSTPEAHPVLGKAFHIVIPRNVEYGNAGFPNSRYGKVDVQATLASVDKPFWFSARTFAKPFADYTGAYKDNAFELRSFLVQTPQPSSDAYEPGLFEDFSRLGTPYKSTGIDDALAKVRQALNRPGDSLDMVLVIDTTKSMVENLKAVKANLLAPIREEVKKFKTFRIGLVFYRDYMEDYITRSVAFTTDLDQVQKDLNRAVADGGGDIPEAVVEALWAGLNNFRWEAQNRVILLMGDAPQHPTPRGAVTEADVRKRALEQNVELQMIMLPQTAF
jgi:Mg-chelatase subunit ChlD